MVLEDSFESNVEIGAIKICFESLDVVVNGARADFLIVPFPEKRA